MKRYLSQIPRKQYPPDVRLVHNFFPGPAHDPGASRVVSDGGFRIWVTDESPPELEQRCYCGWLGGREHYGTVGIVNEDGDIVRRGMLQRRAD